MSKKTVGTTRRQALQLLALGSASTWMTACKGIPGGAAGRGAAPSASWPGAATVAVEFFPLGTQSGDPLPNNALCWTRYTGDQPVTLHYAIWSNSTWVEQAAISVAPMEGGFVHIEIPGLDADTFVAFQFVDDTGLGSAIGQTRTAQAPSTYGRVRFAVSSCTRSSHIPFPALKKVAERGNLDFCLYLGDTSYNDYAYTVDEYRAVWKNTLSTEGYQALFSTTAGIFTWDDHEIHNNWDRESVNEIRLSNATQAYFETLPIRRNDESELGLWRSIRFGNVVEVFVLDCRGERWPSRQEYISPEQMTWLKEGLCASKATWKLIANSVPISNMPLAFDIDAVIYDRWEGFPAQRDELLDHIVDCDIPGVLFLGGDLHMSALARVEPEGKKRQILEIMAGPGGNDPNVLGFLVEDGDQFPYSDARVKFSPYSGSSFHSSRTSPAESKSASIRVESSSPTNWTEPNPL